MAVLLRATVVIAEADAVLREAMAWCLLARGYRVAAVADGVKALELAGVADLIILDLDLPPVDGLSVLRHLSGDEDLLHVPVLAITRDPWPLGLGISAVLLKPFREHDLLVEVRRMVGAARLQSFVDERQSDGGSAWPQGDRPQP